jgi:superfamily I DNA and RNA helicase
MIQEIWEFAQTIAIFSSIIQNFKEYLQKDLENDEGFFKESVNTFSTKVSSLNETRRKEQKNPFPYCMK